MFEKLRVTTQNLGSKIGGLKLKVRKEYEVENTKSDVPFWSQIRWQLILSYVLLAVLPVVGVIAITLSRSRVQAREQVFHQLESMAELKRDQIVRWLDNSQFALKQFMSDPARSGRFLTLVSATPDNAQELSPYQGEQKFLSSLLSSSANAQPLFKELFVYNADGLIVAASKDDQIGKIVTGQPYFSSSLAADYVQPPYYAVGGGELVMFVTHPLVDEQTGQTMGVLAGRLDISTLGHIMTERTGLGEGGETYLVSAESNYLVTPSRFESEGYVRTRAYHSEGIDHALSGENGFGIYEGYRDPPVPVIGVYRWLPELQVAMLGEIDEAEAMASFAEARNFSIVLALVAALVAIIVGLMSATRVSKPITVLTQVATRIAGGHLDQQVEIIRRNEIGLLATAFNTMTDNLRQRIEAEQMASEKAAQLAEAERKASQKATRLAEAEREAKEHLERTVDGYLAFVEQVSAGDLTARLSLNGDDDALTILGHNLNTMVGNLGEMTTQIREATTSITSAAAEILAVSSQQASSANEQSAAISQTSTTIDEVKTIVDQNFGKAQSVAKQAQQTRNISQSGQQAVADTVKSMGQIKEKVEGIAENILALSEQTQQIGEITATVNEIASQSNLLALNASVEAARAGEHGKGFAVVAVEVRNLAEQSKQATAQVKAILNEIQRATNAAVMATEEGTKGVDEGVQLTSQTGQTIEQLAESIGESANAAQQIVASAQQQTTGMEQIAIAMDNINQATVQNMTAVSQAEKSAQDLSSVAQQLEAVVARYKLN